MDSPRKQVVTGAGVPPVIGPYSAVVRSGGLLFVSGQGGIDPATGKLAGETFREQAVQAFRNLEAALHAGGSSLDLVVNTTILLTEFADFPVLNELFAGVFPVDPPARMTMQVVLPAPVRISVGCVAAVG